MQPYNSSSADTDLRQPSKPGTLYQHALLSDAQERDTDLRKWVAVRTCMRLLCANPDSQQCLREFRQACIDDPPNPETFVPRERYFHLRTDIGNLLHDQPGAANFDKLLELFDRGQAATGFVSQLDTSDWPSTLVIGLAIVELRALGVTMRDPSADALSAWIWPGNTRTRPANPRLAADLVHAVKRYLNSRDKLVKHNIRLVYKLARDGQKSDVPFTDMVQDGCAGLLRAAEKYDYRRGYRFTTYAYSWINQHIKKAGDGNGSLITYPKQVHQQLNQVHTIRTHFWEQNGEEPGTATLAQLAGLSEGKIRELRSLTNITIPLDASPFEDDGTTLADVLPDPIGETPRQAAQGAMLKRLIKHRVGALGDMEERIIRGRYGLDGSEPQTFRQLSEQLDISSEWARRLEQSAIEKLQRDRILENVYEEG